MSRLSFLGFAALLAGLVVTSSLSAQGRFGGFGGRGQSLLTLAANEAVQKEIGVTDDQNAKLKALNEEFRAELQKVRTDAGFTGGGAGVGRPTDEQRTKLFEGMKKLNDTFAPKLEETLKPEQLERVKQIAYQAAGPAAYSDAEVIKALDITKEQQEKLATVNKDFQEKMQALFAGGGGGDGAREAFTKLRDEQNAEVAKVITAEQTEKFTKLKGKTFDVTTLGARGPGGAGGRPGGKGRPEKKID